MFSFPAIRKAILSAPQRRPQFPYGEPITDTRMAELRQSPHLQPILQEAREEARRASTAPIPDLTFAQFHTFESAGTRVEFERPYFERRGRLVALTLVLVVDRSDEYVRDLENLIWEICNEYTWCLPACLPGGLEACEADRVPPEQTVDLFAAETSHALAEALFLLGDRLNRWIHYRVRREIERRVFRPLFHDPVHFDWESSVSNWASVCAGAVGMSALLLEDDRERLSGIVERVIRCMGSFLEGYGDDGACAEGISYWQYGFGYYVYFSDMLYQFTAGELDMLAGDKLRQIAEFPCKIQLSGTVFLNYSDAVSHCELNTGLVSRLVSRLKTAVPEMPGLPSLHADHCYRWPALTRNLFWTDPALLRKPLEDGTFYFPHIGCVADRRRVADKTIAFFAKGGHNAEPHNHNDLGHFILHAGGESLLVDLGMGVYTRDYFGSDRYHLLHTSSEGHSVPVINGCPQHAGWKRRAEVIRYRNEGGDLHFSLDLTRAYDDATLTRYERAFHWSHGTGQDMTACLALTDAFSFSDQPEFLEQRFISLHEPCADDGQVIWKGERGKVAMAFDPMQYRAEVESLQDIQDSKGNPLTVYRMRLHALQLQRQMTGVFTFRCSVLESP